MKRKNSIIIDNVGYIDISFRDENNFTQFRRKGVKLFDAITSFEKFLKDKYGIEGFSAWNKR